MLTTLLVIVFIAALACLIAAVTLGSRLAKNPQADPTVHMFILIFGTGVASGITLGLAIVSAIGKL